jgi:hypothetical protein
MKKAEIADELFYKFKLDIADSSIFEAFSRGIIAWFDRGILRYAFTTKASVVHERYCHICLATGLLYKMSLH